MMCLLKFLWTKDKKRDELGNSSLVATFLNYVTHQCCIKTLAILVFLVLVFCLIGNPSSDPKIIDKNESRVFDLINWFGVDDTDVTVTNSEPYMDFDSQYFQEDSRTEHSSHTRSESSILQCSCERSGSLNVSQLISRDLPNSSCDPYATARGPGQQVVSYSFYGDLSSNPEVGRKYFSQIGDRAEEVQAFYPGWLMRLYYQVDPQDVSGMNQLCKLWCQYHHLDLCDVTRLPEPLHNLNDIQPIGRTWRFAVMLDPLVDVFISRDLDSSILNREVSAVNEWYKSNRTFHIMRDHPSHNGYIMAGMWGAKNSFDRKKISDLGSTLFHAKPRKYWDFDQALLRRIVWPAAVKSVLQHDSYSCDYNKFNQFHPVKPFPQKREGLLYVGWGPVKTAPNRTGIVTCPRICRPKNHLEWTTC